MATDEELELLLRRRRRQLEQMMIRQQEEEERARQELQREAILRQILTSEARERLARIKMVRPEFGRFVENQLIALAQAGRIQRMITDSELKEILRQFLKYFSSRGGKVEIRRK